MRSGGRSRTVRVVARAGARRAVALTLGLLLAGGGSATARGDTMPAGGAYGISGRVAPKAYLRMPHRADGKMPKLLSQTGAFKDARSLTPADGLIPYDLIVAFWSDGAKKTRWVAIPDRKIRFSPGEWKFPAGTVFVKTFDLPTDAGDPAARRRLETRLLVLDETGGVYGVDYKWRPDNSDADLLPAGLTEDVAVHDASGAVHQQAWSYPSRQDCLTCHNARAGVVLGVKTRQMNHGFGYPSGVTDNEIRTWNHLGLFSPAVSDQDIAGLDKLAAATDTTRSLEDRARSYLDANCSHCHQPGGTVAGFDARYDTPLAQQQLVDGAVLLDEGIDRARIIAPHDIWRSIAYMRVNTTGEIRMPPLARNTLDTGGIDLLNQWISSLPGRAVLAPPSLSPVGGTFDTPIEVTLSEPEPGTDVRYTLDGSVPGTSDLKYDRPIKLTGPTVIRTRAYKEGFTRSIIAQEAYVVGQ